MEKVHYKELTKDVPYYLDETKQNIGVFIKGNKKFVYFKSVVNNCFAEDNCVIGFATYPNLHFYELNEKQLCE